MIDLLKVIPQYFLPQHALSRIAHHITRWKNPRLKRWLINRFVKRFGVNMGEAENPDIESYASFNAFFTRKLRADARPIEAAPRCIISPVDGVVSQAGLIHSHQLLQAKGSNYSVPELLGGDKLLANAFENGHFATFYLSPRDYHRVHMPLDGELKRMTHVPGRLFSVNPPATRCVPALFARNERVISIFDSPASTMAVILVGAMFVGSIETVWAGEVTPPHGRKINTWNYQAGERHLAKGTEMGRFNMGSTVILLFTANRINWLPGLVAGASMHMGQAIGMMEY